MTTWCRKGHNLDLPDAVTSIWSTRDQRYKDHCKVCKAESHAEWYHRKQEKKAKNRAENRSYALNVEDREWVNNAACDEETSELFFEPAEYHKAADLCRSCPVRMQCLESNLYEPYGFFGGYTPHQRQMLISRRRKSGIESAPMPKRPSSTIEWERAPTFTTLTPQDKQRIIDVYNEGNGLRTTAFLCGVSRSTVYRAVKAAGIVRSDEDKARAHGINNNARSAKRAEVLDMVLKLAQDDHTTRYIASLVHRSENTVNKMRRDLIKEGRLTRGDKHSSGSQ